jgi:hypothetical protein
MLSSKLTYKVNWFGKLAGPSTNMMPNEAQIDDAVQADF